MTVPLLVVSIWAEPRLQSSAALLSCTQSSCCNLTLPLAGADKIFNKSLRVRKPAVKQAWSGVNRGKTGQDGQNE